MAKKRRKKVKRKKKKAKVRRVKVKVKARKAVRKPTTAQAVYTLSFAGGIIVLIAGIIALFFSGLFALIPIAGTLALLAALPNIVCGIVLLIATKAIRKNPRSAAIIILLFSIIALIFPPHGFIVGPLLSLIGSIVLLVRK